MFVLLVLWTHNNETKLQSFRYKGDRKNFNFDKYLNLYVEEQNNQHADLQEYGVALLAKNFKTLWFQDGIRDPSLVSAKAISSISLV
jgi:hypothetical protein